MGRSTRTLAIFTAAVGLWIGVMVSVSASGGTRQNGVSATPAAPAPATTTRAAGYVGEETCLTCHEDQKKGYHGSPHARAKNPRPPAAKQGCESGECPGSGDV